MANKTYYWLKLKNDYFNSLRIKKMRKMKGGDTLLIIYLKIQLSCINTSGVLIYEHIEPTLAEELALKLDEQPNDVQRLIDFLLDNHMIVRQDKSKNSYDIVEVLPCIGKESQGAIRMRKLREKQLNASQCDTSVRLCDKNVTTEKEIEKEIELEIDYYPALSGGSNNNNIFAGISFPVVGGNDFILSQKVYDNYQKTFGELDVYQELLEIRSWIVSNQAQIKANNIVTFINSWLTKNQREKQAEKAKSSFTINANALNEKMRNINPDDV